MMNAMLFAPIPEHSSKAKLCSVTMWDPAQRKCTSIFQKDTKWRPFFKVVANQIPGPKPEWFLCTGTCPSILSIHKGLSQQGPKMSVTDCNVRHIHFGIMLIFILEHVSINHCFAKAVTLVVHIK